MTATKEDRASALRSSLDDAAKLIGSQRQTISELRLKNMELRNALKALLHTHDEPADTESAVAIEREICLVENARAALSRTGE